MSQYEMDEIIKKIKAKSPFDFKESHQGKQRALRVIVSKLHYSLDYENEPQATREKITQLLLYHGQFSKEDIDEIFQLSAKETTAYSREFLKKNPEVAMAEARKSKEFPDEDEVEEGKKPREIKYIFPHYG